LFQKLFSFNVNFLYCMLIFSMGKMYNISGEYIFSSQFFLTKTFKEQTFEQKVKIFIYFYER